MSNNPIPSSSKGEKRRIDLISSEPLKKVNLSANGIITNIKTIREFLNFHLFSEEDISSIQDQNQLENAKSLNSSLQSVSV